MPEPNPAGGNGEVDAAAAPTCEDCTGAPATCGLALDGRARWCSSCASGHPGSEPLQGGVQVSENETPVDAGRTIFWVQVNMGLKVLADCAPISVWPALLKDLYGGDVGKAALAAAIAAGESAIKCPSPL